MYLWRERDNPGQSTVSWADYYHVMAIKTKISQSTLHGFLAWSGNNLFLHWYNGLITSFELLGTVMLEITFSSGHFIIHANKFSSLFLFLSTSLNLASLTWMKGPEQYSFLTNTDFFKKFKILNFSYILNKGFLTPSDSKLNTLSFKSLIITNTVAFF